MKIKEMGNCDKPREKLALYGIESLSDSELLAILIKSGTKKKNAILLADSIIKNTGIGIRGLSNYSLEELSQFEGIGNAKACIILAAVELSKRIALSKGISKGKIQTSKEVADIFMERLRYIPKEHFETLLLDSKGNIISIETISIGDLCSSPVHPREAFKSAIKKSAAAIILVHNHPSGETSPSESDIAITNRLVKAGELLGIAVLDHIIIGDGNFLSMKSEELM